MLDSAAVLEIRKTLQRANASKDLETCAEVLEKLDEGVVATEELLRETKIGVTVNKVAQSPASPQVAAKAKALVKKWKGAISPKEERSMSPASLPGSASTTTSNKDTMSYPKAKSSQVKDEKVRSVSPALSPAESTVSRTTFSKTRRASVPSTTSTPVPASTVPVKRPASATPDPDLPPRPEAKKARESAPPARTHLTDKICFDTVFPGADGKKKKKKKGGHEDEDEEDEVAKRLGKANSAATARAKCCEALYDAIACDSTAETKLLAAKAIEIEQAVWKQNPPADRTTPTQAYRTKVRFLYQNLKTTANGTLRKEVVDGDFAVGELVVCSSADFRTAEQKALEEEVQKRSLQNACFDATSTLGEAMRETMKWRGGGR